MKLLVLMITISFIHIMTDENVQLRGIMQSFKVLLKVTVKQKMLLNTGSMLVIKKMMQSMKLWHQFLRINFAFH